MGVVTMQNTESQVPEGYKKTDVGVIPVDWEVKSLGDFGFTFGGITGKGKADFGHGNARYVTFLNVMNNPVIKSSEYEKVDIQSNEQQNYLKDDDVIFNGSSETPEELGVCSYLKKGDRSLFLNSFCFGYRLNNKTSIYPAFLPYLFRSNVGREIVVGLAQGSTRYNLSKVNLLKAKIPIPTLEEQQAIAQVLTNMDDYIHSLQQLVEKKKNIKQGTMQQLLTGRTRLPGFGGTDVGTKKTDVGVIPVDWEVKRLGDIGSTLIGLTYSPNDVREFGTLVLRSSNIQDDKLAFENNVFVQMDLPSRVIVRENDLLICVRNGSKRLIGKSVLLDKSMEGQAFGAFMSVYRSPFNQFIAHQFKTEQIGRQIGEILGATINQITSKNLQDFVVSIPSDIEEQQAIAQVLTNMDDEITALQEKIEKAKQVKQGAMQELLTGKRRLV